MTLQQLKYICMVEKYGSITRAAQVLYISQPGISNMIHALEEELGITIFTRSPSGVAPTEEGRELIRMAQQLLSDADHVGTYFRENAKGSGRPRFLVSSQHYDFVVSAYTDFINEVDGEYGRYLLSLCETSTASVIEEVQRQRSSLGIIYIPGSERRYMERNLADQGLVFHSLAVTGPYVFLSENHPLAGRKSLALEDLRPYPCLEYLQDEDSPSFYSEEVPIPDFHPDKVICISDLYLSLRFLQSCNAYDIGTGLLGAGRDDGIVCVPLDVDVQLDVGYICRDNQQLGQMEKRFLEILASKVRKPGSV